VTNAASAIFDPPPPQWRHYAVSYGRKRDVWVTDDELAAIMAGVADGTIETRVVKDRSGRYEQWRPVP
jgi:hypothetical protein